MLTSRRSFLTGSALSLVGWAAGSRGSLASVSISPGPGAPSGQIIVNIFLRGGADGLSIVPPHGDDDYYRNRPVIAIPAPGKGAADDRVIDLDGFFGFHPALRLLVPLYREGQLALVHACGSGDTTRSHFEAMATVERGVYGETGPASGWLARHLESAPWPNSSPLRAIALGAMLPDSLRGISNAMALHTVSDLQLQVPGSGRHGAVMQTLDRLYGPVAPGDGGLLAEAGREALSVLKALASADPSHYRPSHGAVYPKDELGAGLQQVALLAKSGVGLEAACLDHGSFDTHVAQGTILPDKLKTLAGSLAAFSADLGKERWARTTVVVVSEFGRRVEENSGAGTDHGRGGVMMVLGGAGLAGGKVHGHWPTLTPASLEGPGDLHVTTDYRCVLAEILEHRLGNPHIDTVFPGLERKPVGVV